MLDIEGGDGRSELMREVHQIEREIQILNVAIEEGDVVSDGLNSKFWVIIKRTLAFLGESYKQEAYEAAKTPSLSPNFFLGRLANLDDIATVVENNFVQGKERAIERKEACTRRIKDIYEILDKKGGLGYTGGLGGI